MLALAIGLGWGRGHGDVTAEALGLSAEPLPISDDDPLGSELSRLAGESVGQDWAMPLSASTPEDSFHRELGAFVAGLWNQPGSYDD